MAGLEFEEQAVASDDPSTRAELLLLSPSFLVPCLTHDGIKAWDTLAIAEYLNEILPKAGLLPKDRAARASFEVQPWNVLLCFNDERLPIGHGTGLTE